jgi:tmRNA-binding protein
MNLLQHNIEIHDKRETIKNRDIDRDMKRTI